MHDPVETIPLKGGSRSIRGIAEGGCYTRKNSGEKESTFGNARLNCCPALGAEKSAAYAM